jgi:CDP-diacylglycerol--glycerol-3-phosphate 3-phosphatidyltransferase
MTIADKFSFSRVVLAPVFFCVYFFSQWTGLFTELSTFVLIPLLGVAEITDFFDGYFARKRGEVSDLGKILDPCCDVILNLTVFFCFAIDRTMPPILFLLILYREFTMLFVRLVATQRGVAIAARIGGKSKTVFYIVTDFFALFLVCASRLGFTLPGVTQTVLLVCFCICTALSYLSMGEYLIHFRSVLKVPHDKT